MIAASYAILRFKKYKGAAVGGIEAHNERKKTEYKSNPDIDPTRSKENFHLVQPHLKYGDAIRHLIDKFACRTRKDSVTMVETLVTASPEFFRKKNKNEIRAYFNHALAFFQKNLTDGTIVSAVVHMDEATPHMHLCFVPITKDGRLSAKEIVGNKQKLTAWQDAFHSWMVKKYPDLERGESSQITGRTYVPTQLFKCAKDLHKQEKNIMAAIQKIGVLNAKQAKEEAEKLVARYMTDRADLLSKLAVYDETMRKQREEIARLEKERRISTADRLAMAKQQQEYEALKAAVAEIPPDILTRYRNEMAKAGRVI